MVLYVHLAQAAPRTQMHQSNGAAHHLCAKLQDQSLAALGVSNTDLPGQRYIPEAGPGPNRSNSSSSPYMLSAMSCCSGELCVHQPILWAPRSLGLLRIQQVLEK